LKEEFDDRENKLPVAVVFSYKSFDNNYCPLLIGMDYNYLEKYGIYRQALYQVVKRAQQMKANKVYLGLSASIEKKKFGARIVPKVAYVQTKDNFNLEVIGTMAVENKK
jgi:hypothetical protein